ncbi:MAG TPA: hypothetical protein PKJ85_01860 [Nitrosomonas nitrosa]|nr:hypothetical protein [Nitrosomonas nitrosa]
MHNDKKIVLLKKFNKFCETAPRGAQAQIWRNAHGKGKLPLNKYSKSSFSTDLKNPEQSYSKIPNEIFESIMNALKNAGIEDSSDCEKISNIEDYFGLSLSLFVDESPPDKEKYSQNLMGKYWSYTLSSARKGYLSKSLMIISLTDSRALLTEEFFYYSKSGVDGLREQKAKGYVVGKNGYFLFLQDDDHSPLLRVYILRPNGDKQFFRLSGRSLNVNNFENQSEIITRRVIMDKIEGNVPDDPVELMRDYNLGVYPPDTDDPFIKEIFDLLNQS